MKLNTQKTILVTGGAGFIGSHLCEYLLNQTLGDKIYDPTIPSQEIKNDLDYFYQNISLLLADTESSANSGVYLAKFLLQRVDLARFRDIAFQGRGIADRLPSILGKDGRKTYLVLFQNNMELRPTGGFIGSFGLFTFDRIGAMVPLKVGLNDDIDVLRFQTKTAQGILEGGDFLRRKSSELRGQLRVRGCVNQDPLIRSLNIPSGERDSNFFPVIKSIRKNCHIQFDDRQGQGSNPISVHGLSSPFSFFAPM